MTDQWMFKSQTFGNCNCDVNCGCQFERPSTHGCCHSFFAGQLVDGHFNDMVLAGLNWVFIAKFPGEIAEGNGTRQIIIDEHADAGQRAALEKIISGEPFHVALARPSGSFEFTYAEIGLGTTKVTGDIDMAFEGSYAQFCVHHYDQNGLVRAA